MRATGGISSQRLIWLLSALLMALSCPAFADELSITPSTMVGIGTVDERLQSYNVEMVEVTGGRFWKPYGADRGGSLDLYQYRPPIDLTNTRLRKLAAGIGASLHSGQRHLGKRHLFCTSDSAPAAPPSGLQRSSHSAAMARRGRFLARCGGADRDFIRRQSRHPRCLRRVVTGPGAPLARLHLLHRGPDRGGRVHERARCRGERRYAGGR